MRVLLCFLAAAALGSAQQNPFIDFNKHAFAQAKTWILGSADKMAEADFSFKPTDKTRSFGQVLGHVADSNYGFCSAVLGEKAPDLKVETTKTSKAEVIAALKAAFTYCDKAYDSITEADLSHTVKLFGSDMPKPLVLEVNALHDIEHYGNLVVYLRLKNIVPPSSDGPPSEMKK